MVIDTGNVDVARRVRRVNYTHVGSKNTTVGTTINQGVGIVTGSPGNTVLDSSHVSLEGWDE